MNVLVGIKKITDSTNLVKTLCCRKKENNKLQKEIENCDKWEVKNDDVTVCEELGHGAFGKVYKGIMKAPCLKTKASLTVTVAVKMLEGMLYSIIIL